uniref:Uncharacterized protein n=1 Tax=Arundo donax TaxID=35708 RepID=A0A0A8Z9N1_ARUDO
MGILQYTQIFPICLIILTQGSRSITNLGRFNTLYYKRLGHAFLGLSFSFKKEKAQAPDQFHKTPRYGIVYAFGT